METNEFNTQNEQSTHCSQPVSEMQQAKPAPPDNYLALAILSTLFCCLPLGIVSIVYSAKVNNLWVMGHYDEARRTARKAKKWALASVIATVALVVLYVLFVLVFGITAYSFHENVTL